MRCTACAGEAKMPLFTETRLGIQNRAFVVHLYGSRRQHCYHFLAIVVLSTS